MAKIYKNFIAGILAGFTIFLGIFYTNCQSRFKLPPQPAMPTGGITDPAAVLQYHKQSTHAGLYVDAAFTKAAAAHIHMDANFSAPINGDVYSQPLYVAGNGSADFLIVATEQNHVMALNADTGAVIWDKFLGPPMPLNKLPCGNIDPLGITGTPVIDGASKTVFLDAMTTPDGGTTARHLIFALSLDDGAIKSGWPIDVNATAKYNGQAITSMTQNQRGALTIVNQNLYVPYGGHDGDCGVYHGWIVSAPLNNPAAVTAWATGANEGGIWSPGGITSDGNSIYFATGNTGGANTWSQGESVIRLPQNLAFSNATTDYYAPLNWKALDNADLDVGGSSPIMFTAPGATPSNLIIALGKDGNVSLMDANNLGGIANPLGILKGSNGEIKSSATAFTSSTGTYVSFGIAAGALGCPAGQSGDLMTVKVSATAPPTLNVAWCANQNGNAAPITTSVDGNTQFIVWGIGAEGSNRLYGFDGETGAVIFNGGGAAEQMSMIQHFQTLTAAKGRIFVPARNQIYAFTLK